MIQVNLLPQSSYSKWYAKLSPDKKRERFAKSAARLRERMADPAVRARRLATQRRYQALHAEEIQAKRRLERYGLTEDAFAALFDAQGGRCPICSTAMDPARKQRRGGVHVDHHHKTGQVRALLCPECNKGIGSFAEDPARMRAAAEYIERHRGNE